MKGWRRLACVAWVMGVLGCTASERWEGTLQSCSNNGYSDGKVLLVIDSPRGPSPTGWAGRADSNNVDTWLMAQLEDTSDFLGTFNWSARYDIQSGSVHSTEDWKVELSKDGFNKYKGDAEILATVTLPFLGSNTETVRCKISYTQEH